MIYCRIITIILLLFYLDQVSPLHLSLYHLRQVVVGEALGLVGLRTSRTPLGRSRLRLSLTPGRVLPKQVLKGGEENESRTNSTGSTSPTSCFVLLPCLSDSVFFFLLPLLGLERLDMVK